MFGRIDFITTLHAPALEQRFVKFGVKAQLARGNDTPESFLRAERGSAAITVPAFVREQVQVELMRLDRLVATVEWLLNYVQSHGADANVDLLYEQERAVWDPWAGVSAS